MNSGLMQSERYRRPRHPLSWYQNQLPWLQTALLNWPLLPASTRRALPDRTSVLMPCLSSGGEHPPLPGIGSFWEQGVTRGCPAHPPARHDCEGQSLPGSCANTCHQMQTQLACPDPPSMRPCSSSSRGRAVHPLAVPCFARARSHMITSPHLSALPAYPWQPPAAQTSPRTWPG